MIHDIDTKSAGAPATTERPARIKTKAAKAKTTRAKSATTKSAKAKAIAVQVVHDDAPAPAAVVVPAVTGGAVAPADIDQIVAQIREAVEGADLMASASRQSAAMAIESARHAGQLLIDTKRRIGHGGWEKWMADNLPDVSQTTACRYMRLASKPSEVTDLAGVKSLYGAYAAVGILPEKAKGQRKAGATSEGKGKVAISDAPRDAGGGGSEAAAQGVPPEQDGADAVSAPEPEPAVAGARDPEQPGPDAEAAFVGLLDRLWRVMVVLRDPDAPVSPGCLKRAQEFGRRYPGFLSDVTEYARAKEVDERQGRLPMDDAPADGAEKGVTT